MPLRLAAVMSLVIAAAVSADAPHEADGIRDARREVAHVMESEPLFQRWRLRLERALETPDAENPHREKKERELPGWIERFADWIGESLDRFFNWLGGRLQGSGSASSPFDQDWNWDVQRMLRLAGWVAVGLLTLLLAIFLIRKYRRGELVRSHRVLSRERIREALEQGEALSLSSDQWLDEAGRLAGDRDFRAVYRALYLALLSGLHDRGRIDFRRNRTNWYYVERFRGPETHRPVFSRLTGLFDEVWYGSAEAVGSDLGSLRADVKRLLEAGHAK